VSGPDSGLLSRVLTWGFRRYVRRFVRSNFNATRVVGQESLLQVGEQPLVVYVNHPGWWDPMAAVLLTDMLVSARKFAAPMDADALKRYPVLERLGFFGVSRESISGAREFLRHARSVLQDSRAALWMTPAGQFHDVRQSLPFQPGLAHLVDRSFGGAVLPLALEYPFWNERRPELLAAFGSVVDCSQLSEDREERTGQLESGLREVQDRLRQLAIARDPGAFTTLLDGSAGIGGWYDIWRRMAFWRRGQRFSGRHEERADG